MDRPPQSGRRIGFSLEISCDGAEWVNHRASYLPRKAVAVGRYLQRIVTKPCIEPRIHVDCVPICRRLAVEGLYNTAVVGVSSRKGGNGAAAWKRHRRRSRSSSSSSRGRRS